MHSNSSDLLKAFHSILKAVVSNVTCAIDQGIIDYTGRETFTRNLNKQSYCGSSFLLVLCLY